MIHKLLKKGNTKVYKNTLIFNLPTHICGLNCAGCYAKKAETRFPSTLAYRNRNHYHSHQTWFRQTIYGEISKAGCNILRIHESGDFYSQEYLNKWAAIAQQWPHINFYAYTKKRDDFDFSVLDSLKNVNIINSRTPLGYNFGDQAYCNRLVAEYGYVQCPCKKGVKIDCMKDCQLCLILDKICFLKH